VNFSYPAQGENSPPRHLLPLVYLIFFGVEKILPFLHTKTIVMRTVALALSFVAFSCAANAQLTLLPQVGFENSKTIIRHNNFTDFSPLGVKFTPQASLRLSYTFKQGHGFFLGAATSRSVVLLNVADPELAMSSYTARTGNMQWRFESGYQFSTKPITLGKGKSNSKQTAASKAPASTTNTTTTTYTSRCGKTYTVVTSRCGSSRSRSVAVAPAKQNDVKTWVRIQPSIGVGFIPSVKSDVVTKTDAGQPSFEYKAGNWNTALLTGMGFEFGKNSTRLFTVSVNYFNGMGNLGKRAITTTQASKTTTNILQSDASGWNVRVGIPFTLGKKPAPKKAVIIQRVQKVEYKCGQQRTTYRCGKSI
jgi:hypothetical protein